MKTIILKSTLALFAILWFCNIPFAQTGVKKSFTMKQAMDYAAANSYKTKSTSMDFKSAVAQRKGYIAIGLPQVNASASYQYYLNIPTMLFPNFLTPMVDGTLLAHGLITPAEMLPASDSKFPVQFGTKNNFTASASASQLIFDGSFIVGLKAARLLVDMNRNSWDKSINDTKATVAQAYYMVLIASENQRILDSTYLNLNDILTQTKAIQANGFIDETDIEQIALNVSNLKTKLEFNRQNISLFTDLLKFQMGIDLDSSINLSDKLSTIIDQAVATNLIDKNFDVSNSIDYRFLKSAEVLQAQSVKVDQAKYYPSMNLIFNVQENAQRDKFDFFKKNGDWFNTTLVGVNLSIPIWSSGIRHYKIQQDKFGLLKQQIITRQAEEGLKIDVQNGKQTLKMNTDQLYTDRKNMELANKIYNKTQAKFKEGLASAMDLNQAYLQLLTQESYYIGTMMQLLNTYTNLSKTLNTL
jgi:outer membrane protein